MKKYIYSIVAATAMFASCSQNAELNEIVNTNSKAITTIGASTWISSRATVSSDATASSDATVIWEPGDQLGVLGTNSSSQAKNLAYILKDGSGTTSGKFSNDDSDITTISAIMYPYQENATWDGTNSKLTCEIPPVQTAVKGSFDKNAAVMYSIGNITDADANLNFAVNFLKVTIGSGDANIHSITISSQSTQLSGRAEITTSGVDAVQDQSLKSVTLTAGKNQTFAAGVYYIAIMPSNIDTPTISIIRYEDGHTAKEYSKVGGSGNLVFASGTNVKPISVNFSTITNATKREAVQLWADGPYWATFNVGVSGDNPKPQDYGGYYGWGGSTDRGSTDYNRGTSVLSGSYDTAAKLWGSNWRMPTLEELQNAEGGLLKECNCSFSSGLTCTGKGDYANNSVFLPATGLWSAGTVSFGGMFGSYWSSAPYGQDKNKSYKLYISSLSTTYDNRDTACLSVRAVLAD